MQVAELIAKADKLVNKRVEVEGIVVRVSNHKIDYNLIYLKSSEAEQITSQNSIFINMAHHLFSRTVNWAYFPSIREPLKVFIPLTVKGFLKKSSHPHWQWELSDIDYVWLGSTPKKKIDICELPDSFFVHHTANIQWGEFWYGNYKYNSCVKKCTTFSLDYLYRDLNILQKLWYWVKRLLSITLTGNLYMPPSHDHFCMYRRLVTIKLHSPDIVQEIIMCYFPPRIPGGWHQEIRVTGNLKPAWDSSIFLVATLENITKFEIIDEDLWDYKDTEIR